MVNTCKHENFASLVEVNRLTESDEDQTVVGYSADVSIRCADCGLCFEFMGLPGGVSPSYPTCSVFRNEARMPIRPPADWENR